jgi:hypothetical protein
MQRERKRNRNCYWFSASREFGYLVDDVVGGDGGSDVNRRAEDRKASVVTEAFELYRATSYSPTHLRVQYHRG